MRSWISWLCAAFAIGACSLTKPSRDEITGGSAKAGAAGSSSGGSGATPSGGGSPGGGGVPTGGGGVAGSTGGATGGGGVAGTATGGAGGSPADGGVLLFADAFDVSKPEWGFGGDGNWSPPSGGTVIQTDIGATHPTRWVKTLDKLSDYHVVARGRCLNGCTPGDGVIQIIYRLDPTDPNNFYYASFGPGTGELSFGIYFTAGDSTDNLNLPGGGVFPLPTGHDPNAWFTIHLEAKGNKFTFWVDEVPGFNSTTTHDQFATGAPGLKTYILQGEYDWFEVYSL